jgi:four helix bundle protein
MGTLTRFEDLEIWKEARSLFQVLIPLFEKAEELKCFELKSQIERSSGSVMDNIAEGFEREGTREFIQFLAIAKASLGEVRSQLYRAYDRKVISKDNHDILQQKCLTLAAQIAGFIKYLNNSSIKGQKFRKSESN